MPRAARAAEHAVEAVDRPRTAARSLTAKRWTDKSDLRMSDKKPILSDHKREGRVLVPPIVAAIGEPSDVRWIHALIPELLWIALLAAEGDVRSALRLVRALVSAARASDAEWEKVPFGMCSGFAPLPEQNWQFIRQRLEASGEAARIRELLQPLAAFYPKFPLRRLWEEEPPSPMPGLDTMEAVISKMFRRDDPSAVLVQAIFVMLHLDAQVLHIRPDSMLLNLAEIERYPETDLSRHVAASVRATLNAITFQMTPQGSADWSNYFWNRGLELRPCRTHDE